MKGETGWSDIVAGSFWGCLFLFLLSVIPLLTILAGILTIKKGLLIWGVVIIILGALSLIGPFYRAAQSKGESEKSGDEEGEGQAAT